METIDFDLPIEEFLELCQHEIPATYGKLIVKKIIHDSGRIAQSVSDNIEKGDIKIRENWTDKFYEVKTSFLNKGGKFGIKNIRSWQDYDRFILCFVDTTNDKYRPYFYCVDKSVIIDNPVLVFTGMNNTKETNMKNMRVALSTSFDMNEHSWLFGEENYLGGNTYQHLINFIKKYDNRLDRDILRERYVDENLSKPVTTRGPVQKVYLKMGDKTIWGSSNKEVMKNLVTHIGPKRLDGIIWRSSLNKQPNENRTEYVGDGYYLNPKFSLRDFSSTIQSINHHLGLSIQIIKK